MDDISEKICFYSDKSPVRFHMPGHKGRKTGALYDNVVSFDITELPSTDNLYAPYKGGAVERALHKISVIYQSGDTVISAGGATLALQAALLSLVRRGYRRFIFDDNCHVSLFRAAALCGIEPEYYSGGNMPNGDGVFVTTSPDYYGRLADIKELAYKCHLQGKILMVDCSHGAHLAFYKNGSLHPNVLGADIVVDSLHKTMPALTGAALLHCNCGIKRDELLSAMSVFASTSPSYLIAASASYSVEYMNSHAQLLDDLLGMTENFEAKISKTPFYILRKGLYDPFRIALCCPYDTVKVNEYLASQNIISEFADGDYIVLIPSVMSRKEDFDALSNALCAYASEHEATDKKSVRMPMPAVIKKIPLREAMLGASESVNTENAVGRTAAEPVYAYPPGTVILPPGALITNEAAEYMLSKKINTVNTVK